MAMIATAITCASIASADFIKTVGSWTVIDQHPDPGREVVDLTSKNGRFVLSLYCLGGPWRLFLSEVSERDVAENTSPVVLTYSIDGSLPRTIVGEGHKRYRFELHDDANTFVSELMEGKKQLAFAIEPRKQTTIIPIEKTREAIEPYLDRCPLASK